MSALGKILIIDDNPKLLQDTLPMYGYETDSATDGISGLKMLQDTSKTYDLVILDVMMPVMDGWETLKNIRNNDAIKEIPVIMLSAVDEDYKQISGLKIGADDYIVKPYVLPNLLARIEALLRRSMWNKQKTNSLSYMSSQSVTPLTQREKEILSLVAKGKSNAEIADKLFVREVTVKTHLNSIYKKLNVENRVQAVLLAIQSEIIKN